MFLVPSDRRHCPKKVRLVADYAAAVAAYNVAAGQLEEGMITASTQVYEQRHTAAEEARAMCEAARKALTEHVDLHGC